MLRGLVVLCVVIFGSAECSVFSQPVHVHLALGERRDEMVVTWSTREDTGISMVEYGIGHMDISQVGTTEKFVDGGKEKRVQFIHKVVLAGLAPNTSYRYHCGGELGWSPVFFFKTFPLDPHWQPHIAIYGDLGHVGGVSFPPLQREVHAGVYDAILHVGDFAYDLHTNEGETGDQFMEQLEPIAAYIPYMVSPGNHEFSYHYRARFNMPGGTENFYYSYNIGPVHFISLSSEHYYTDYLSPAGQYAWIEADLLEATKPQNRATQPWIVTLGHRPMYCTSRGDNDCHNHETRIRVGMPADGNRWGLEPLFYKYGVDVQIWGHEHDYERLWPIYDYKVYNGSVEAPYTNPTAPVHIISGSAGSASGHDAFDEKPDWVAVRSKDDGYTRLKVWNASHLRMEQVSVTQGKVGDSFWIVKDSHEAFTARGAQ